jgi:Tfp pilus assembly protein FimT
MMYLKKILLNPYGVTLLEIVFVTVIIGILAELAAHNFIANAPKYRLHGAARQVAMSIMEARNRALQQSINTEIQFLYGGKRYSIWHDYDFDNQIDPDEKTVEDLEKSYPGVYVDYDKKIAFDARGFLTERILINIESTGAAVRGKVIEVSLAGSVRVQ